MVYKVPYLTDLFSTLAYPEKEVRETMCSWVWPGQRSRVNLCAMWEYLLKLMRNEL